MILGVQTLAFPVDDIRPRSSVARTCNLCNHPIKRFVPVGAIFFGVSFKESPLDKVHHEMGFRN